MPTPNRYRDITFIGARILQARELNLLQYIDQGFDSTNAVQTSYDLQAIYKQGAFLNVQPQLSGNNVVTFVAINGGLPALIFVRDRFESLISGEGGPITLPPGSGNIYMNWVLVKVTSAQDPALVDFTTGTSTAEMGELQITISATDTSGVALGGSELSKNTSPIIVATYTGSGGSLVVTIADHVFTHAQGGVGVSGLVQLTGPSPAGLGVGNNDPRMSDSRPPAAGSVVDASVRVPVTTGNTNADGTDEYTIPADGGTDPGGVSGAKIILLAARQTLEAGWNWLKASFNTLLGRYNAHEGAALGSLTTHPFPTAIEVGAVPASHVGQPLNLSTSHPATVNQSTGGFRVNRDSSVVPGAVDPAYGVFESINLRAGITHDGDIFSILADGLSVPASDGDGPLTHNGTLGLMSLIAGVVSEHISKNSHKNPHGLALSDIGGASLVYVDAQDANTLAAAENYTDSKVPHLSLTTRNVSGGRYVVLSFAPNGGTPITIAFGAGTMAVPGTVPLPDNTFTSGNAILHAAVINIPFANGTVAAVTDAVSGMTVSGTTIRFNGSGAQVANSNNTVQWFCVCWK
jgi:hypothetical protein